MELWNWCVVLVEMPLTRFEVCWPLPKESLPELPLKPQHSNPNPNPLANQLWCFDFLTPPTPLIIPHRLHAFLESLMPLKNWCSIHARCSKSTEALHTFLWHFFKFKTGGCPRGVMVKAMDCGIAVREFVLQSRYYVHFRANTLGKGMNPLILPAMG